MKKTEEIRQPSSCLNQSQSDEPLFVLCGRDPHAPAVVRVWAAEYLDAHAADWTARRMAKHAEALELADEMERWRLEHVEAAARTPAA